MRHLASQMLSVASGLLPAHLASWSRAMGREMAEIADDRAAVAFAGGCLRAVLALAVTARFRSLSAAARGLLLPLANSNWRILNMNTLSTRPRLLGLICGAGAVGMGLMYMLAAGAPSRYLLVNCFALVLGATAWLMLGRTARSRLAAAGPVTLVLALPLLLTALFGVAVDGASRWVNVGPLSLQVSLILLPALVVVYSRRPDGIGAAGMIVAALALALQPDRAMAGVLMAGLAGLVVLRPSRFTIVAAAASALAFVWTLLMPDTLPAVHFVDRVLYTAFDVHPLAGFAVVTGAAALVVPAAIGAGSAASQRPVLWAFGGCWAGVIAGAALGNYPTPLVGYGGSAVLGYLLSVALLPNGTKEIEAQAELASRAADGPGSDHTISELCAARLA
jgi:cell division protein FtsW (lipid II flippase)